MAAESNTTDRDRRRESKEIYEQLIRTVDHQSGHIQPPLASKPSVIGIMSRSRCGLETIHSAIVAARRNGDLFEAVDDSDHHWLGIDDEQRLLEKIERHLSRSEHPRKDLIGIANKRRQQLRGDDDE